MNNNHGNNTFVTAIIHALFEVTSHPNLDELARQAVELFIKAFPFKQGESTEVINIPYKDIADVIFQSDKQINSDSIGNFKGNFKQDLEHCQAYQSLPHKSRPKFLRHFIVRYEKVVEHAQLAQVQRHFIRDSIESKIQDSKTELNKLQELAKQAKQTAEKAEKIYETMFANYVTILGVFTAIIVTIFGGLNVISVVAKQADTPLETVVFLTALALMCVVSLLYFLANIIIKITQQGEDWLNWLFGIMIAVCVVAMIVSWCMTDNQQTPAPTQANIAIITQ